jgi:hypothetical protein
MRHDEASGAVDFVDMSSPESTGENYASCTDTYRNGTSSCG